MSIRQSLPTEIRVSKDRRDVKFLWDDGQLLPISAELLRVMSTSAEVKGHNNAERRVIGGKRDVAIEAIDQVGNYAIKIQFSDGHHTGIYTWPYLRNLGEGFDNHLSNYLDSLEKSGLAR